MRLLCTDMKQSRILAHPARQLSDLPLSLGAPLYFALHMWMLYIGTDRNCAWHTEQIGTRYQWLSTLRHISVSFLTYVFISGSDKLKSHRLRITQQYLHAAPLSYTHASNPYVDITGSNLQFAFAILAMASTLLFPMMS
jgi:hypothetical protein